jgi:1,4-dihydroxy-2-naphthoate octaprenyltransferase
MFNAYYDYAIGLDKKGGSAAKTYCAACEVIPSGRADSRSVFILANAYMIASLGLMTYLAAFRGQVMVLLGFIGIIVGYGYSVFFKPKGLGEMAVVINFGPVCFFAGYLACNGSIGIHSLMLSVLPAILVAPVLTIDAAKDKGTDFAAKVRTLASHLSGLNFPLSRHIEMSYIFLLVYHGYLIATGTLPGSSFAGALATPLIYAGIIVIDEKYDAGALYYVFGIILYEILMVSGLVLV